MLGSLRAMFKVKLYKCYIKHSGEISTFLKALPLQGKGSRLIGIRVTSGEYFSPGKCQKKEVLQSREVRPEGSNQMSNRVALRSFKDRKRQQRGLALRQGGNTEQATAGGPAVGQGKETLQGWQGQGLRERGFRKGEVWWCLKGEVGKRGGAERWQGNGG